MISSDCFAVHSDLTFPPDLMNATAAYRPELLAPAGDWDCAKAAVANGADAIYFGLPTFNARMRANNFSETDLPELMRYLHDRGRKGYLVMNTLVFTRELPEASRLLSLAASAGVDAAIVQDVGLTALARTLVPGFEIHASTQMSLTSPEGLHFAKRLGVTRAVVARELSLRDLAKFQKENVLPLETFVHGALCVAYSGQCLTSEALGQRSANRGECAQACRLPYGLIVDGALRDLGDRRYLLSPQDLAAIQEIPNLMALGVASFKIEGRLKTPEYVAAVTQVYRKAIDAVLTAEEPAPVTREDWYQLEMTFSRGLFSGWLHGVNHQNLVHARFGKKRGAYLGTITHVGPDFVKISSLVPLQPGDGVVFDTGGDTNAEQGGRIYQVEGERLRFQHGHLDFTRIHVGDRLWKTDDPQLEKKLRQSFARDVPVRTHPLSVSISGRSGSPMTATFTSGPHRVVVTSSLPLATAERQPLDATRLRSQLERLGGTPFHLDQLDLQLEGPVILPVSEINRLRREAVEKLSHQRNLVKKSAAHSTVPTPPFRHGEERSDMAVHSHPSAPPHQPSLLGQLRQLEKARELSPPTNTSELRVLCRTMDQLEAALEFQPAAVLIDFEDIRRYRAAVEFVRTSGRTPIYLATPRIQKAGEEGFFRLIAKAEPDGVLVRNPGAIHFFRSLALPMSGDFSLNVANPLTADTFIQEGVERLAISYDLNSDQVIDLLGAAPPHWFEIVIHQHIPMFHMEHCVFAAFLSDGTDHTNCGRPCDRHEVRLRDRMGVDHLLKADVGCRNTLFHHKAQSGATFFQSFHNAGARCFRIELLDESPTQTRKILSAYSDLLQGHLTGQEVVNTLQVTAQLGVTSGTLTVLTR